VSDPPHIAAGRFDLITRAKVGQDHGALGPAMKLAKSTTFSPEKILSFMVCLVRLSKGQDWPVLVIGL
jgi:hypothetical protein